MSRVTFLNVDQASDSRFNTLPTDGIIHLEPEKVRYGSGIDNIVGSLVDAKLLDQLQFSVWLNQEEESDKGGELILGGVDNSHFKGQINWPKTRFMDYDNLWALNMDNVTSNSYKINTCPTGLCKVYLSFGVSEILGPRQNVETIYKLLNSTRQPSGLELIDCKQISTLPDLIFSIDNVPYVLKPNDYIGQAEDGECYVAIMEAHLVRDFWTLGSKFLKKYYSIFDMNNQKVGFAKPNQ